MDRDELPERMHRGETIQGGSALHAAMHEISQEALRITAALNTGYQDPGEVRRLLGALTGQEIDASVTVFPPLRSDFGKALRIGCDVFINSGCAFQDQGGITIGDGAVVGASSTVTKDVPAGAVVGARGRRGGRHAREADQLGARARELNPLRPVFSKSKLGLGEDWELEKRLRPPAAP
ncbi:hypothetical protein [Kocuria palustris]|uniref:hypothetical protein n=1 Tax=Kocuria palustris TaxID=71999 RepID=UPI0028D1C70C|nr:hypothetical protein [Kocuria palustris]